MSINAACIGTLDQGDIFQYSPGKTSTTHSPENPINEKVRQVRAIALLLAFLIVFAGLSISEVLSNPWCPADACQSVNPVLQSAIQSF